MHPGTEAIVDTGYQGLQKIHKNTRIPKKKTKKNPLTVADKKSNHALSSDRVFNENVIRALAKPRIFVIAKRFGAEAIQ